MYKTARKIQSKPLNVKEKGNHPREAVKPSPEQLQVPSPEVLLARETPFQPPVDRHAALLSRTGSDAQRVNLALHLQRSYGNTYTRRLLGSAGTPDRPSSMNGRDPRQIALKKPPAETPQEAPQTGTTAEKNGEETYESKPLEGMDRLIYDQALARFKIMKRPRIFGGESKANRRFAALTYLKETVEESKAYTGHRQMIVNSILQAYKDTFGEELQENKAAAKLETKEQEKVSKWQKFKTFVSSIFKLKSWVSWIKSFYEFCKDPVEATAEKASNITLPAFLSFAQPVANQISAWTQWLPILGIVSSLFSIITSIPQVIKKFDNMLSLKSAVRAAQKKKDQASVELGQAAGYGYAKVKRAFWSKTYSLIKAVADLVLGVAKLVVGLFSGGIAAIVVQAIQLSVTLVDLVALAYRKIKGFGKWLLGTRGKARRQNAEKIVMSARDGSEDAMRLLLQLDPSGIARGDKLDKFWYWLKYWGAEKKAHEKQMLMNILKDWDKKEINTLVEGVAEKLKSQ